VTRIHLLGKALKLGVGQLSDPRVLRVVVMAVAVVAVLTAPFAVVFVGAAWLIELLTPANITLPWLGEVGFLGLVTTGLGSRASWLFWSYFVAPLALATVGLFLDTIVNAVERRHYGDLPAVRTRSQGETIFYAARFFGLTVSVSLAALIVSLFSGWLGPVVLVGANGYLIAREYFETVAMRRLDLPAARQLMRENLMLLWSMGGLVAVAMTLPYINLLVPAVGVATFTHLFHMLTSD
jgi:CysZ protein